LAPRLKDMFQYVDKPDDFDGVRELALTFDHRFWQKEEEHGRFPTTMVKSAEKGKTAASTSRSSTSNQKNSASSSAPVQSSAQSSAPSTSSANRTNQSRSTNTRSNDSTRTSAPSTSTNQSSQPSSSKTSRPRGPLSQEEKDRRRAENLCLYCGLPGHGWAECKLLPANRQKPTGRAVYTFTEHDQEKSSPTQGEEESS